VLPPPPAPLSETCSGQLHSDASGRVVLWGASHLQPDAAACCAACEEHEECNVWVFCPPDAAEQGCPPRECWLKRQEAFAGVPIGLARSGAAVPWTSGRLARFTLPAPDAQALGLQLRELDPATAVAEPAARPHVCGSPAADAYSSVSPSCLEQSPTALEFDHSEEARLAQVVWAEAHASYDGLAVGWGVGNKKPSAAACADACRRHEADAPGSVRHGGLFGKLPCNAFVYCPLDVPRCFEPDAHTHTAGDCWLKFTEAPEAPEVNARGAMEDAATVRGGVSYSARHASFAAPVPWTSGVLLPPGRRPGNGTWGPRALW